MTDLRALLGDRYEAVIERAAVPITGPTLPKTIAYSFAAVALAAVLPDLLAAAWDEGRRLGLRQADYEMGAALNMPDLTNPYRAEETER